MGKANAGDLVAIRSAAYIARFILGETGLDETGTYSLLIESALQGDAFARMEVVQALEGCRDFTLVQNWISAAASDGVAEFMLWEADDLIQSGDATSVAKAATVLRKAATVSDSFIRLWIAGLVATHPTEQLRDAPLALQLSTELIKDAANAKEPDYMEALAAAQAANARFPEATASEQLAIRQVAKLKWNTTAMEKRLETYQSGRAWTGLLCDCAHVAPNRNW